MKLTDKQKKEIIEKYVSGNVSQRALAESYHVSKTTISKILGNEKVVQKFTDTANQNTLSMLAFMESKNGQAQNLISEIMDELKETLKEKMKKSSLKDCVNAIELLSKTFTFSGDGEKSGKDALNEVVNAIKGASEK